MAKINGFSWGCFPPTYRGPHVIPFATDWGPPCSYWLAPCEIPKLFDPEPQLQSKPQGTTDIAIVWNNSKLLDPNPNKLFWWLIVAHFCGGDQNRIKFDKKVWWYWIDSFPLKLVQMVVSNIFCLAYFAQTGWFNHQLVVHCMGLCHLEWPQEASKEPSIESSASNLKLLIPRCAHENPVFNWELWLQLIKTGPLVIQSKWPFLVWLWVTFYRGFGFSVTSK